MLIRFKQGEVHKLVHRVASFATRAPDPFSHLLIRARADADGGTVIVANNRDAQCWSALPVTCEEDGEVLVRADMLVAILDRLPDVELILKTGKTTSVLCGKDSYRLASVMDVSGFPGPEPTPADAVAVAASKFVELVEAVKHAAAVDDVRYYLNGILVRKAGANVEATGCDGHRLARATAPFAGELGEAIIPSAVVPKMLTAIDQDGDLRLALAGARFHLEDKAGLHLAGSVIDGKYPDADRVISSTPLSFTCDAERLRASVERACVVQSDLDAVRKFRWVRLSLAGSKLRLSHEGKSSGMEETVTVDAASGNAKAVEATVNAEYLLGALGSLKGPSRFHFPERADQPLKIEQDGRVLIIMQMRV